MKRDADHENALRIRSQLIAEHRTLVTTNYVIAELHALLLARIGHRVALQVLIDLLSSDLAVVRVSATDEHRALQILKTYSDKGFSFTDATSFAIMDQLGTRTAFTFDHHFAQYGMALLTTDR